MSHAAGVSAPLSPRLLWLPLEALLAAFACWTVAFDLALALRPPAWSAGVLWLILMVPMIGFLTRRWRGVTWGPSRSRMVLGTLLLSFVSAGVALLTHRPDADDFDYFARVVAQSPAEPFLLVDTVHRVSGPAPKLHSFYVMTAYEPLFGSIGWLTGASPLLLYHNAGAAVAGAFLPVVFVLLSRDFRLSTHRCLVAGAATLLFLLLDGNTHRSWGNVTLLRLWQGKTILWGVLLPLLMLLIHRFMRRPNAGSLAQVTLAALCGTGLSTSGLVMIPALVAAAATSELLLRPRRRTVARALWLGVACAYPLIKVAGFFGGMLPLPQDLSTYTTGWPADWAHNVGMVLDNPGKLARDGWLLSIVPLVALGRALGIRVAAYALAVSLLFVNPIVGPFWMAIVQPAAYWRFLYLLPVPWCAGLAAAPRKRFSGHLPVAAVTVMLVALAFRASALTPPAGLEPVGLKSPWDHRFSRPETDLLGRVLPVLTGRAVLAPERIAHVLALLTDSVRLEAARGASTARLFRGMGEYAEADRRVAAQQFVTSCGGTSAQERAFKRSIQLGVDAVIAGCPSAVARTLQPLDGGDWMLAYADTAYTVLLRR